MKESTLNFLKEIRDAKGFHSLEELIMLSVQCVEMWTRTQIIYTANIKAETKTAKPNDKVVYAKTASSDEEMRKNEGIDEDFYKKIGESSSKLFKERVE